MGTYYKKGKVEVKRTPRKAWVICPDGMYEFTGDKKYLDSKIKEIEDKFALEWEKVVTQ